MWLWSNKTGVFGVHELALRAPEEGHRQVETRFAYSLPRSPTQKSDLPGMEKSPVGLEDSLTAL